MLHNQKIAKSWGSFAWYFLHFSSLKYNKNLNKDYKKFIHLFYQNIPCIICKNNFRVKLRKYPLHNYLDNNDKLFKWTVLLHNDVNKHTYRKIFNVNEARKLYNNKYRKNQILQFLYNFYISNVNKNRELLVQFFKQVILIYPKENVKRKLMDFNNKCKVKMNKVNEWIYVYLNIIKNN